MDNKVTIGEIKDIERKFVEERGWGKFHDPKSLAMSVGIEAAELMEIFQWKTTQESYDIVNNLEEYTHLKEEMADVVMYIIGLANTLNIDLSEALIDKSKKNALKYPKDDNKYTNLLKEEKLK